MCPNPGPRCDGRGGEDPPPESALTRARCPDWDTRRGASLNPRGGCVLTCRDTGKTPPPDARVLVGGCLSGLGQNPVGRTWTHADSSVRAGGRRPRPSSLVLWNLLSRFLLGNALKNIRFKQPSKEQGIKTTTGSPGPHCFLLAEHNGDVSSAKQAFRIKILSISLQINVQNIYRIAVMLKQSSIFQWSCLLWDVET